MVIKAVVTITDIYILGYSPYRICNFLYRHCRSVYKSDSVYACSLSLRHLKRVKWNNKVIDYRSSVLLLLALITVLFFGSSSLWH